LTERQTARQSRYGDDYLSVKWVGSEVQAKVHKIVERWMTEDRISGGTVLGGHKDGGMFGWGNGIIEPEQTSASPISPQRLRGTHQRRQSQDKSRPFSPTSPKSFRKDVKPGLPNNVFGWNESPAQEVAGFSWASAPESSFVKPLNEIPDRLVPIVTPWPAPDPFASLPPPLSDPLPHKTKVEKKTTSKGPTDLPSPNTITTFDPPVLDPQSLSSAPVQIKHSMEQLIPNTKVQSSIPPPSLFGPANESRGAPGLLEVVSSQDKIRSQPFEDDFGDFGDFEFGSVASGDSKTDSALTKPTIPIDTNGNSKATDDWGDFDIFSSAGDNATKSKDVPSISTFDAILMSTPEKPSAQSTSIKKNVVQLQTVKLARLTSPIGKSPSTPNPDVSFDSFLDKLKYDEPSRTVPPETPSKQDTSVTSDVLWSPATGAEDSGIMKNMIHSRQHSIASTFDTSGFSSVPDPDESQDLSLNADTTWESFAAFQSPPNLSSASNRNSMDLRSSLGSPIKNPDPRSSAHMSMPSPSQDDVWGSFAAFEGPSVPATSSNRENEWAMFETPLPPSKHISQIPPPKMALPITSSIDARKISSAPQNLITNVQDAADDDWGDMVSAPASEASSPVLQPTLWSPDTNHSTFEKPKTPPVPLQSKHSLPQAKANRLSAEFNVLIPTRKSLESPSKPVSQSNSPRSSFDDLNSRSNGSNLAKNRLSQRITSPPLIQSPLRNEFSTSVNSDSTKLPTPALIPPTSTTKSLLSKNKLGHKPHASMSNVTSSSSSAPLFSTTNVPNTNNNLWNNDDLSFFDSEPVSSAVAVLSTTAPVLPTMSPLVTTNTQSDKGTMNGSLSLLPSKAHARSASTTSVPSPTAMSFSASSSSSKLKPRKDVEGEENLLMEKLVAGLPDLSYMMK